MSSTKKVPVGFSLEQIHYLEEMFPEITASGQSYADTQYRAGQRSVLTLIKRVSNARFRYYIVQD